MKNNEGSRIGRIFSSVFNFRSWLDYERIRAFTQYLVNVLKKMFVPQKYVATESFEQAMLRQNISEKDLVARKTALYRLSILMCFFAFLIFIYTGYQLFYGSYRAVLVSIVVMLIALVLAFRYHFWYFQIKERKLGVTLREWYKKGLKGDKA